MAEPSGQPESAARTQDAHLRSQELQRERARLRDRVLETAELVRRSYERTAETMDILADTGPAEHAMRRRQAAERSRRRAEDEVRQVAALKARASRERNNGHGAADGPDIAAT